MSHVILLAANVNGGKVYLRRANCNGVMRYNSSNGDIVCFASIFDAMHARRSLDLPEKWRVETFSAKGAI